jgi:hypothetical protein
MEILMGFPDLMLFRLPLRGQHNAPVAVSLTA